MDITRKLAEFVYKTEYMDIPRNVRMVEKQSILDNIGIISGGADGDGCREFVEYAVEAAAGGREEATVLGFDIKLPAILKESIRIEFCDFHNGLVLALCALDHFILSGIGIA